MSIDTLPERYARFLDAAVRFVSSSRGFTGMNSDEFHQAALDIHAAGEDFDPMECPIIMGALAAMWANYALADDTVIHTDEMIDRAKLTLAALLGLG